MTETNDFTKAAEEVAAFVEDKMVVTVADIVKAMPQHERIVFSLLDTLRMNGRVYWDEWRPLPTLIHAGDRRIPESTYKYDWVGARERTWKHRTQDLEKVGTSGSKELAAA